MELKKEWKIPVLEVLDVNQTMQHVKTLTRLDATFTDGTLITNLRYS